MRRGKLLFIFALLLFGETGCATYTGLVKKIRKDIHRKRYESALKALDNSSLAKSEKDSLIYYLDKGTLLFLLKKYDQSIEYFQKAKERVDQLFATSVHKQAESFLSNDISLPYKGEDFERVLIHYYLALNYLMKGNLEDALVESRQVILYLNEINDRYKKKNVYHDDAFVRYLNGILFETDHEFNDSYVDYYHSYLAFKKIYTKFYHIHFPRRIYRDLKRLATFLGMNDDLRKWDRKCGCRIIPENEFINNKSEVILILETGFIPRKEEGKLDVVVGGRWVRIAFPVYKHDRPSKVKRGILIAGKFTARSILMEPLAEIAKQDLLDRGARIMARAAARIAIKHGIAEGLGAIAEKSKNQTVRLAAGLLSIAGHIAASASEKADIRGWYTLPHDIHLIRLLLDPGEYDLKLKLLGKHKRIIEVVDLGKVALSPGERIFRYYRAPY